MWKTVAIFDVSNSRFQTNVRILKIPTVFDYPKVFSRGSVVFDEQSILRSQSYFKWRYGLWWFKGTDDPKVSKWQKVISDGGRDFYNPKAFGDTFIFDGLVQIAERCSRDRCMLGFGRHWSHGTIWLAKRGKVSRSQNQYLELKLTNKESLTRVH